MVILTSDNGSFMYRVGEHPKHPAGSDGHVADVTKQAFDPKNHQSNYIFRGTKADIYEGGHHVPFFVRWPNEVKPDIKNNPICHTDFFSTAADILNVEVINEVEGEDSFSFLPLLKSQDDYQREPVIHHSANGTFAIRKGDWKLILSNGSGGRQQPSSKPFVGEYQLYDLGTDIQESKNLASENLAVVSELLQDFDRMHGRTETLIDHKN
jgi:arylsulfatase A